MFLLGFGLGFVVSGVVFIVFHKNNKRKINAVRDRILSLYESAEGEIRSKLDDINRQL